MKRKHFLLSALGGAVGVLAVRLGISDPDVPRRVDCREGWSDVPVAVYQHGRKLEHVVAYDLDADSAVVVSQDPDGKLYLLRNAIATTDLHGGIVVRWDRAAA